MFSGVRKLKTRQVSLHIILEVNLFNLRGAVESRIQELVDFNIIKRVNRPTLWVNLVVIVPKPENDGRLCLDMRWANEATVRECFPIPTVDELLQGTNGSTIFSKLDLNWGSHQLELTPESLDITTFAMHIGVYRCKKLLFGVSPES